MMKMRGGRFLLGLGALLLVFWAGCDDEDPVSPGDTTSPAAVTDLRVQSVVDAKVTLAWTAPGDDGDTGTAAQFDIRYSGDPVTEGTWAAGTLATTEPTPAVAGTEQYAIIDTGGKASFHFALKTADEASNWSGLSNVVMASVEDPPFLVRQLTTEGQNIHPCVDDGHVVWVRRNATVDGDEIFSANLDVAYPTPTKQTDNGGKKEYPNNHGIERIVWQGRSSDGDDWEIWVYDHYAIPRYRALTDNEVHDRYADLDVAGNFAWLQDSGTFEEVRYWIESSHSDVVISDSCCPADTWTNGIPSADDGAVVWRSYDQHGTKAFTAHLWDGALTDLTDTIEAHLAVRYSLYEGTIAYEYGANSMIRYWNGSTALDVAEGYHPSLSNGTIAFEEWDGHDWEIRFWDGSQIQEITDNDFNDTMVSHSGSMIAWAGRPTGSSDQIFYVELGSRAASNETD